MHASCNSAAVPIGVCFVMLTPLGHWAVLSLLTLSFERRRESGKYFFPEPLRKLGSWLSFSMQLFVVNPFQCNSIPLINQANYQIKLSNSACSFSHAFFLFPGYPASKLLSLSIHPNFIPN